MEHTIITIGRQFGAGGLPVAEKLGSLLNIPVYDKSLLAKAAESSGFSRELFEGSDEKRRFSLLRNLFGINRSDHMPGSSYIDDGAIFRMQSAAMRDIAGNGSAIFVGRASNYVLRDLPCLNVFICAPLADRIKRVAEREGLSAEKAEALISRKEKERSTFYDFYTYGNWGCAQDYDLCLNSSLLGIDGTAEFIMQYGKKTGKIL